RDLKECLRLQLENFETRENESEADKSTARLTLKIIDKHWEPMARHSYEDIARKMRRPAEEIQAVADFIRIRLTPDPGRQYRPSWQSQGGGRQGRVRPDVEIKKLDAPAANGKTIYEVSVQESRSLGLRVNGVYRQLWDAMRRDPTGHSS